MADTSEVAMAMAQKLRQIEEDLSLVSNQGWANASLPRNALFDLEELVINLRIWQFDLRKGLALNDPSGVQLLNRLALFTAAIGNGQSSKRCVLY